MFKQIAIVSGIVIMTAMIGILGVTSSYSTQNAYAQGCGSQSDISVNVCNNNICVQANVLAQKLRQSQECTQ